MVVFMKIIVTLFLLFFIAMFGIFAYRYFTVGKISAPTEEFGDDPEPNPKAGWINAGIATLLSFLLVINIAF